MTSNDDSLQQEMEKRFSAPMPWVGVYVAAASLLCTLAMAADLFHGLRHKKLWFPCKYFTLNAASLTVIAVAMKLPVDLNNSMPRGVDQVAKLSSTGFMCVMMANFMPSLGPMNGRDLFLNLTALSILVITIFVNVVIQISTGVIEKPYDFLHFLFCAFLLYLLLLLTVSAFMIPVSKKILEHKYLELHRIARTDEPVRPYTVEKLTEDVSKYWIMAETSNPQFVVACSPTCSVSGVISFFAAFIVVVVGASSVYYPFAYYHIRGESDYKWSVFPIAFIQYIGLVVGSIASLFRLFRAFSFKSSLKQSKSYLHVYKIERYWTQILLDWKSSRIPLQIGSLKCQKFVHGIRNLSLNCLIGIQIFVVVISKTTQHVTMFIVILLSSCWYCCTWVMRKLIGKLVGSNGHEASADDSAMSYLRPYVLQLQDEVELANRTLIRISKAVHKLIKEAEKKQPSNLMKLLEKSTGFEGVAKFDNDQVPALCSSRYPNSWSLVVVNLTSIFIALAKAKNGIDDCLLSGISEGLLLVQLIEESLDPTEENMVNARRAASNVWLQVEFYHRWLDEDLQNQALRGKTSLEILQWLSDTAKRIFSKTQERMNVGPADSSFLKVVAANSMYRICQSILLDHEGSEGQTDEMLFDKLCVMTADILSACITNIQRVIAKKCDANAIGKREANVKTAAQLVGQTKEIIKFLQQRELPGLDANKLGYIDEWHAFLSPSSNRGVVSRSSNQLLNIVVE